MCDSSLPARRLSLCGFTIIELMIALTMIAILLGIAAPSITEAVMSIRITGQSNDLMSDLALARSEAAKRNVPVVVCMSKGGANCDGTAWNQGWVVYPDMDMSGTQDTGAKSIEKAIKMRPALEGANTLTLCSKTSTATLTYMATGNSTSPSAEFRLCDTRTTDKAGRTIAINSTGRPIPAKVTCPITTTCPTP